MQPIVATSIDKQSTTTDAMYQYMADCRFGIRHLNAMCLLLAMEYVYQPQPRFWRDFKIQELLDAVTRLIPEWEALLNPDAKTRMLDDIRQMLRMNAFDEENAQRLLTLPPAARPVGDESVSTWLFQELEKAGRFDDLAYARRDGLKCGRHALEMLHILAADATQQPKASIGTLVARTYRDGVMNLSENRKN